jgi:uncharacterized protein
MIQLEDLRDFVKPFYENKDAMHSLTHVENLYQGAMNLGTNRPFNHDLLMLGAYFHGIFEAHKNILSDFLVSEGLASNFIESVFETALESLPESSPKNIEGMLLHDAHLLEGGREFLVTKSLLTGCERGQSLAETLEYMKENILGKRQCVLPEAQLTYRAMEDYAIQFVNNLEAHLNGANPTNTLMV